MAINIVSPKHVVLAKIAAAAAQPGPPGAQLIYNGGPLLANVDIVAIYWGSAWLTDPLMAQLDEFFNFVVSSSLISELQEYNVPGFTIGNGQYSQCIQLNNSEPGPAIDDSQIQSQLQSLIASGMAKASTPNTLYIFLMPSGTTVTLQGSSSCQNFCGYHSNIGSDNFGGPFYAVLPHADCQGCVGIAGDVLDSSTVVLWHEIAEAITDPIPGAGWYDNNNGEIGDICEGGNKVINTDSSASLGLRPPSATGVTYTSPGPVTDASGVITVVLTPTVAPPPPPPPPPPTQKWTVQLLWSNAQNACI